MTVYLHLRHNFTLLLTYLLTYESNDGTKLRIVMVVLVKITTVICGENDHRPTQYNILDVVPPSHVVSNHVATDTLTTANGGLFT